MTDLQVFKLALEHLKISKSLSQKKVGELLGYTNESAFSQVVNGKVKMPDDIYDRMEIIDPDIKKFILFEKTYRNFDNDNTAETVTPHIQPDTKQLMTSSQNHKKPEGLIPFYNADFIAGNAELYYDDETIYPEYYMDVPEFSGSTAFRAYGDSMEPRIKSGNILFGVKRENWNLYLEYGQIYGITCKDGSRFLKYVRKHQDERFLLLKSENPNYDDMEMPKSEIKNIWLINGWIDKRN